MRGFTLYWFSVDDTPTSGKFKEKVAIPSLPINFAKEVEGVNPVTG